MVGLAQGLLWQTSAATHFGTEFLFANLYFRAKQLFGLDLKPLAISFSHAAPVDIKPYKQFFDAPVTFSARTDAIFFTLKDATLKNSNADEKLFEVLTKVAETQIAEELKKSKMWLKVIRTIEGQIDLEESVDIKTIAELLGLNSRHMQRILNEECATFIEIRDATRKACFHAVFRKTTQDVAHTADILGFSDASTLRKSYTRWFGGKIDDAITGITSSLS